METEARFEIPELCRAFGVANFKERLYTARALIEQFVKNVAPPKALDDRDEAWTRSVRRRFIEMCPKDCYPSPNDPDTRKGEYLVDYTWAEVNKGKRVLLACESEWGTEWYGKTVWSRVEHDFEKLLAVKAPFKVLIFSSYGKPGGSKPSLDVNFSFDFAKERVRASLGNYGHHLAGEVYILTDFPQTGVQNSKGRYEYAIWLSRGFGKQRVAFDKVGGDELLR